MRSETLILTSGQHQAKTPSDVKYRLKSFAAVLVYSRCEVPLYLCTSVLSLEYEIPLTFSGISCNGNEVDM